MDTLERPFPAYKGDEPYIFVSYAHADEDMVYPESYLLFAINLGRNDSRERSHGRHFRLIRD